MSSCAFCAIVAGTAPATILEDWTSAMVIVPHRPVTPGHVLVIPKIHVPDFVTDPSVSADVMARAGRFCAEWYPGEDVNLITSKGAAATQTVFHLHLHVVPRTEDDRLLLPWSPLPSVHGKIR